MALNILTWIDLKCPDVEGCFMDSYSNFQTFRIKDALDIMEQEVCYLATFGTLRQLGTIKLHQYIQDNILVPLSLWETKAKSTDSHEKLYDLPRIIKWHKKVEDGYIKEIKDIKETVDVKVEVVDEVKEEEGDDSSISEIEGWEEVNMVQWE